ncbi:GNAT family N-acetyltransferase [Sulfitobacter sp. MF3-043]|uniref:GNAT family N-acetyltransferase n=1 Tax=Sulfitobacter sediminivivens TaxID=3252902 RepID=UPI0036DE531C
MQLSQNRPTLKEGHVHLRGPRAQDAAARFKLGNVPAIHHMFGADPANVPPITKAHATTWLHAQEVEPLAWIIEYRRRMVGAVRLHSVIPHLYKAELAIGILDPKYLGKGIGTMALQLLAAYAFGPLFLRRLSLRVVSYNDRAIAAFKKVGFVEEGREREAGRVAATWHDDVIMGLLARDFAKVGHA